MKKYKIIFLGLILLLISGCATFNKAPDSQITFNNINIFNGSFWEIDNNTSYLQPINFGENRTVRVWKLIVESPDSIVIGGMIINSSGGEEPFSSISASETFLPIVNLSRIQVAVDRDFIRDGAFNGTTFLANRNLDFEENSNAFTTTSDPEGNGNVLIKWNRNHEQPFLNNLVGLRGNYEILTTPSDNDLSIRSNRIRLGFYENLTVTPTFSVSSLNNKTYVMEMNTTQIELKKDTFIDTTMYFNESFIASPNPARTSPDTVNNNIALFGRDDGNLYIKRPSGQIKRVSVVGSGSSVFSEEVKFNNHTYFYGNVYFNNSVYNGGSHGIACFDNLGRLYKSSSITQCSGGYVQGTINDTDMGLEFE